MQADKRLTGFVRALLKARIVDRGDDGAFRMADAARSLFLTPEEARRLAAAGIVALAADQVAANQGTLSWLRRQLSEPDPFAGQHRIIVDDGETPFRNLASDRIAGAQRAGFLKQHHVAAAERVSGLIARAGLRPRVTMSYSAARIGSGRNRQMAVQDLADGAATARAALNAALGRLPDDCAGVVVDVCGFEKGLQTIESERGWPRRSAKLVLRIALEQLAAEFGLSDEARGKERAGLGGWMEFGARPERFE